MRMHVGEPTLPAGDAGDHGVDALEVGTRHRCRHAEEVAGVVAEGRVVDRAEEDRADREAIEELVELASECVDIKPAFAKSPDQIVAASGNARGATGHGVANLREFDGSAAPAPAPPGMANPLFIISRSFTLSLHPGTR